MEIDARGPNGNAFAVAEEVTFGSIKVVNRHGDAE
jgi:hypothetical protein